MTLEQLAAMCRASASLNWDNPPIVTVDDPAPVTGKRDRFYVLWTSVDGVQRVYGGVNGRWGRRPDMRRRDADIVAAHLREHIRAAP